MVITLLSFTLDKHLSLRSLFPVPCPLTVDTHLHPFRSNVGRRTSKATSQDIRVRHRPPLPRVAKATKQPMRRSSHLADNGHQASPPLLTYSSLIRPSKPGCTFTTYCQSLCHHRLSLFARDQQLIELTDAVPLWSQTKLDHNPVLGCLLYLIVEPSSASITLIASIKWVIPFLSFLVVWAVSGLNPVPYLS
jgi:hypothetical protein